MTNFPVSKSTLSASALGQFVATQYGLSPNTRCELFRTGINHTYFITDKTAKYVLRVYTHNWRTKAQILEELRLLNRLKANNISISYPIADLKGEWMQPLNAPEGERYAVLFSFAEGEKVRFMDTETCFSIGAIMANIHRTTQNQSIDRINYTAETLVNLPYQYLKPFFSEEQAAMQFIKKEGEAISQLFDKIAAEYLNTENIQSGIIHLDIWYDNMNVSEEKSITIFDFDFCGNGWFIFDIAYFCKQLFHIEADKTAYELKYQAFLKGYQSVRTLSVEELQLIPKAGAATWIFYLGVQAQRFDWSNIFFTKGFLDMFVGRIKSWLTYYEAE